ncbi:MAG: hypothetical protein ACP5R4_10670 [Armatimonadota bacterium]
MKKGVSLLFPIIKKAGFPAAVLLTLLGLGAGRLSAQDEVMVVVASTGFGMERVSFSFPKQVPHNIVRDLIRRLDAEAGWRSSDIRITDDRVGPKPFANRIMTSAEFTVQGAFIPSSGTFYIQPFLRIFASYRKIGFVYLVPRWFEYRGPRQYENEQVKVQVTGSPGSYTLEVEVKDPSVRQFTLPARTEPSAPAPKADAGVGKLWIRTAFVLILAVAVGLLVYAVSSWILSPSRPKPREEHPNNGAS